MSIRHLLTSAAVIVVFAITPLAILTLPLQSVRPTPANTYEAPPEPAAHTEIATVGAMTPNRDWLDWSAQDGSSRDPLFADGGERPAQQAVRRKTFRTLCVRLCDGFYWPISHATQRDRIGLDAKKCDRSCPGQSRLFMHRNPGEDVNDMVDRDGRPYRKLPAAFLYRSQYVADCTCHPHPWEEEALARHRSYSLGPMTEAKAKPR